MKTKLFNKHKIMSILKENKEGISIPALARKYGLDETVILRWKAQYAPTELSELKQVKPLITQNPRFKRLESENKRLRQMYLTLSMDYEFLKEMIENSKIYA